jgi:hypothetical protein
MFVIELIAALHLAVALTHLVWAIASKRRHGQ